MKLRIRLASAGPSFKIEVPSDCSLRTLRQSVSEAFVSNGIPFVPPIRLSLNKVQEMQGAESTLLVHLGVRSGDLLYCIDGPSSDNSASSVMVEAGSARVEKHSDAQTRFSGSNRVSTVRVGTPEAVETETLSSSMASSRRELCAAAALKRASLAGESSRGTTTASYDGNSNASMKDSPQASKPSVNDPSSEDPLEKAASSTPETKTYDESNRSGDMQIDVGSGIEASHVGASNSIPVILQRVLIAESGNVSHPDDLLILAVHAVMLETGFVVWNATVEGSSLPSGWSRRGTVSLCYTLPEIGQVVEASNVGHAVLRCQTFGNNVVLYGNVTSCSPPPIYRLCLQTSKYIPAREDATKRAMDPVPKDDLISCFFDLFGLWKCVKDELSLPLLTALCERAGLPVPSSLLRIPIELKMKILECLPALDLLNLASTCSELRHLSANDELWERLYLKEFGSAAGRTGFQGWKVAFQQTFSARALERRMQLRRRPYHGISSRFTPYRGFHVPRFGGIIGGEHDIYPSLGGGPFRGGLGSTRGPSGGLRRSMPVDIQPRFERGGLMTGGMGTAGISRESLLPGMDLLGSGSQHDGDFFD